MCLKNMKVLSNTGNYFDIRVPLMILDADCEMGGGLALTTLQTDAWLSQTQNMVTGSYSTCLLFIFLVSKKHLSAV